MKHIDHLAALRRRLKGLRRARQRFRWATAASAAAIAVLLALAVVFALDWSFQRNIDLPQRLLLEGLAVAGILWALARFSRPWLGKREDDTEMALLVQRQAGIDSDLVAALQFESADAAKWGSTQLETQVIDRVAATQEKYDVMASLPRQPLARRRKVLIATVAAWALVVILAPQCSLIFFKRLAFGPEHYPSQTRLVSLTVNGKSVDLADLGSASGKAVHVPCGEAVRFEVMIEGARPAAGRAEISTQLGGAPASIQLEPSSGSSDDGSPQAPYRGEFAKLSQSARYQIYVGDAWTDPLGLSVTPLPAVEIEAEVVQPDYARHSPNQSPKLPRGMRDFAVLAGSEVKFKLDSDRPLSAAEMSIGGQSYALNRYDAPTDPSSNGREFWTLAAAGTPLASVAKELPYSIQIHDVEGQTLDRPLEGTINIEPDLPPGILASTKTTIVLPTGSPNIHYEASDDHALSRIWLTWEATAAAPESRPGDTGYAAAEPKPSASGLPQTDAKREGQIEVSRFPSDASPRNREADYRLALGSLPLKPGDTLKVTFHASDYRGPAAAATADADPPLVFQVTDVAGFEASMYEADQKSAEVLDEIRKKHSGLGETQ